MVVVFIWIEIHSSSGDEVVLLELARRTASGQRGRVTVVVVVFFVVSFVVVGWLQKRSA